MFPFVQPLEPILAEQFHRVRRSNGSIPTPKIVGRTEFLTSPADALRVLWMNWEIEHAFIGPFHLAR
jgi:hypothetical protein